MNPINQFNPQISGQDPIQINNLQTQGINPYEKDWTLMIYLNGDNTLEQSAIADFLKLSITGSDENVNILVQFDRTEDYSSDWDNWNTTKRFYVTKGMTPTVHNCIEDLGELDMADPNTLQDFIQWGVHVYPARKYGLILWDHVSSNWKQICVDRTSNNSFLSISNLEKALENVGQKLEFIGFDSYYSAFAEIDSHINDWAKYRIGSQNQGYNWPYDKIIDEMQEKSTMETSLLMESIINLYFTDSVSYNHEKMSISIVQLDQYEKLVEAINIFADNLILYYDLYEEEIYLSRLACYENYKREFVDLYEFAEKIRQIIPESSIQNSAKNLIDNISSILIIEKHENEDYLQSGINIFFSFEYDSEYYENSYQNFNSWNIFLSYFSSDVGMVEDNYEGNNDEYKYPYDLRSHENIFFSDYLGLGYQLDDDWYLIKVAEGENLLKVNLTYSHSTDELSIRLRNKDRIILKDFTTHENIHFSLLLPTSNFYYIEIEGNNKGNPYDLWWDDTSALPNDDNYEYNDDFNATYDLTTYQNKWLSATNGAGIQKNDDWYSFIVSSDNSPCHITINSRYNQYSGSFNLNLLNSSLEPVIESRRLYPTDGDHIEYVIPESGVYFIKISGENTSNIYDLKWYPQKDDIFENNNDANTAFNLTNYPNQLLSEINIDDLGSSTGIQWDADWFQIEVPLGLNRLIINAWPKSNLEYQMCKFTLFNESLEDPITYDGFSTLYNGESTGIMLIDINVEEYCLNSRIIYFEITGKNEGLEYEILWNCFNSSDDNYEGIPNNNNITQAYNLTSYDQIWFSESDGYGYQWDEDWYQFLLPKDEEHLFFKFEMPLHSTDYGTNWELNVALLNSTFDTIANFTSIWYDIEFDEYLCEGVYFIQITGENNGVPYDIWIDTLLNYDDNYEGIPNNNDIVNAYDLSTNEDNWLSLVNGYGILQDTDIYKVNINPGEELLNISLSIFSFSYITMNLVSDSGSYVPGSSKFCSKGENFHQFLVKAGIYYIVLNQHSSSNPLGFEYDLWWNTQSPIYDDKYEDNDELSTAYGRSYGEGIIKLTDYGSYGIQSDDDWYIIKSSKNYDIKIDLLFNHDYGNLDMALYNSLHEEIAESTSVDDNETIVIPKQYFNEDEPIYYYLLVHGDNRSTIYDIIVSNINRDDYYEDNDTPQNAFNMTNFQDIEYFRLYGLNGLYGKGYQYDDDWYSINCDDNNQQINLFIQTGMIDENTEFSISIYNEALDMIFSEKYENETIRRNFTALLPDSGNIFIKINGSNTGYYYYLICSLSPNPIEDNYENNNQADQAYDLERRTWLSEIDGIGVQIDPDWYRINITSEEKALQVKFTSLPHVLNEDITLALYNSDLNLIHEINSNGIINMTVPSLGIYYLQVFMPNYPFSSGLHYDLWWDDLINDSPMITDFQVYEEIIEEELTLSINYTITDPDNDKMNVFLYNANTYELIQSFKEISSDMTLSYTCGSIDENFEYKWFIYITDGISGVRSSILTYPIFSDIPNEAPNTPILISPTNGIANISINPILQVYVSDPDSEFLNITFVNAEDDKAIGSLYNMQNNSVSSIIWANLTLNTTYSWYVIVDDGKNTSKADIFSFTTIQGEITNPSDEESNNIGGYGFSFISMALIGSTMVLISKGIKKKQLSFKR